MSLKINYISYLDPRVYQGGGEMVMKGLIDWGVENLNLEINYTTVKPFKKNYKSNADLNLMADIFNTPESLKKFPKFWINKMIKDKPFVHFDNSYVDACNMGYLPCSGQDSFTCEYKNPSENIWESFKKFDFSKRCTAKKESTKFLYESSALNVFVSPLHQKTVFKILNLSNDKSFVLRPMINTENFKNLNLKRDIDYLFVGAVSEAKGYDNLVKMFKNTDKKLTIAGPIADKSLDLSFADYIGKIPYEDIPELFNRAKNYVHIPRWPEPQGRVVVEAALCGCQLITNDKVGATSFDFDISDPANLQNVEAEFWEKVGSVV